MCEYSSKIDNFSSKVNHLFTKVNYLQPHYSFPVDAVITFRGEMLNLNNEREGYNYEIKYCLRSITKNMPWIRNIYVFQNSDAEIPSFFDPSFSKRKGILLIKHDEVIPKKYLPTNNSDAIETFLTLLPGLSEHFVYFNDDFFVNKPTPVSYFFTPEGIPKRVIYPRLYLGQTIETDIKAPPSPGTEIWYPHVPIAFTKKEINNYLNKYPKYIEYIRSIRSRKDRALSIKQCIDIGLTFPCLSLQSGIDYMKGGISNGETENDCSDYIQFPIGIWRIKDTSKRFFCIADHFTGSLEDRSKYRKELQKILNELFPEKSRAE